MPAIDIKYSYKDVPTLKRFSESNAFIRAAMGPFGSGKSSACVIEIIRRALAQAPGQDGIRRSRWAVVRNSYPQLRDTTVKTFHQWLPPNHFGDWRASDHNYIIKAFENAYIEVMFRALDRPDQIGNLLSLELTGAWVNEAREVPWSIINALEGRVGRYPAMRDGGPTWHGILLDTNPPDSDSKFYRFFEETEQDPSHAVLFKQPSGISPEAENLTNLIPNYYQNLAKGKDDEWRKVYIEGQYGFVIDGKPCFPMYHDSTHCQEFSIYKSNPIYRGWDFGLTPACCFAQLSPDGQFLLFDELVTEDMGVDQFSDEVITHSSIHFPDAEFIDIGDPAGEQRAQTDARTCFQILKAKGIEIIPGLQSTAIRLESMRKPMMQIYKGKPGLLLHPRCKTLRKAFSGGYHFRRLQTSEERYTSIPNKNHYSHIADAAMYLSAEIFGRGLTTRKTDPAAEDDFRQEFMYEPGYAARSEVTGY